MDQDFTPHNELEHYPKFAGGLLVEVPRILTRVGSGVGVSLNAGWEVGLDLNLDTVADPRQMAADPEQGAEQNGA